MCYVTQTKWFLVCFNKVASPNGNENVLGQCVLREDWCVLFLGVILLRYIAGNESNGGFDILI